MVQFNILQVTENQFICKNANSLEDQCRYTEKLIACHFCPPPGSVIAHKVLFVVLRGLLELILDTLTAWVRLLASVKLK